MADMPVPPVNTALLGRDKQYSLYGYQLENENCYKSLGNSYDHFREERFARERCDQAKSDGAVWKEQDAQGVRAVVRDTFEHVRLCFWIELAQVDGRIIGELYSWQGRSYSGYPIGHWSLWDIRLQFSGGGQQISRLVTEVPLGQFKFARTPWKFSMEVPPGGVYDVAVEYTMEFQSTTDYTVEVRDASAPVHKARHDLATSVQIIDVVAK